MRLQVYGTGCKPCKAMVENVTAAVAELGLDVPVEHMTRVRDMLDAGVTGTPTLAIDGQLVVVGKLLDVPAIKLLLSAR